MSRCARLLFTGLVAATVLAAAVGTASANRLSISNRNIRAVWTSMAMHTNIMETTVRCPVTMEGSFQSATMRKTLNAVIGRMTRATITPASCTGGTMTANQETLPWTLTYKSFAGTLPNITDVTTLFLGISFNIELARNICRFTSEERKPFDAIAELSTGRISGYRVDESFRIPLDEGPGGTGCSLAEAIFAGTGSITLLGNTSTVSITLI